MNFQKEVIERSHEVPVLVDFWAPWCGPCRVLGPVIEQIAEEQQGKWDLVKVNTEEEQELAMQYRIRSIPNVKLFHKGEVINEFSGALPRHQILQWLEEHLPSEQKSLLASLLEQEQGVPDAPLRGKLRQYVRQFPDDLAAKIQLARHMVFHQPEEAVHLVQAVKLGDENHDIAEDVRTVAHFLTADAQPDSPVAEVMSKAQKALRANEHEAAIQHIIEATAIDKTYEDELPRRTAVALFRLWGNAHELSKTYRRRFDMMLY